MLVMNDPHEIPTIITVSSSAPQLGVTSLAANVGILLAQAGHSVLLLDLNPGNNGLTTAFVQTNASSLEHLAAVWHENGGLEQANLLAHTVPRRPNLSLLPSGSDWLESPFLQAEHGWNVMQSALRTAKEQWQFVVADLGSAVGNPTLHRAGLVQGYPVHLALRRSQPFDFTLVKSTQSLEEAHWLAKGNASALARTVFVVNRDDSRRSWLSSFKIPASIQERLLRIPTLPNGMLPRGELGFLVEREIKGQPLVEKEQGVVEELKKVVQWIYEKSIDTPQAH